MLILNTAQELIKHSPAFEDTPIYLKVFTMGTNTVLTISLLGGVTQGLNILLAGRSRYELQKNRVCNLLVIFLDIMHMFSVFNILIFFADIWSSVSHSVPCGLVITK